VKIELQRSKETVAQSERSFGIRPLGAARRSFWLESKRWVLRGVDVRCAPPAELTDWREAGATMIIDSPSDAICAEASRTGVLIVARLDSTETLVGELRRLASWPAVGMVVLKGDYPLASDLKKVAPNLLLIHLQQNAGESLPAPSADAVLVPAERLDLVKIAKSFERPILVQRSVGLQTSVAAARALCDGLQRDSATLGDFAGYVIGIL
jgi:hypothetical protein